jgi:two-component system sensor histidine kinase CreC
MSLRLRLLLLLLTIYAAGGYFITRWGMKQVRPRYLESMEETLVDTSVLLASAVEAHSTDAIDPTVIREAFDRATRRHLSAKIFGLEKTAVDLRVYATDAKGRVVFDSQGAHTGEDFSGWNDVARTLRGQYGARSTHSIPHDETQVIYVAAPVYHDGRIVGVVSVGKPTRDINGLVATAQHRILVGIITGGLLLLVVLLLVTSWVIAPIERLTRYAQDVRDGKPTKMPTLPGKTLQELGTAFEQMRDALEGRQHVERYTQALAHEVKAPLAAIRGAAELLDEDMPVDQRQRFLLNIRNESARIQRIIERLLELTAIEARKTLPRSEAVNVSALVQEAVESVRAAAATAGVEIRIDAPADLTCVGDPFLLRQALGNLVQNAVEFSPRGATVAAIARRESDRVEFAVEDEGPGVPAYALPRVFERFYSLPRPGRSCKSTGIGLALVREIAHLHGGEAILANRATGGARASFWVPQR